mmetsp:Transcript_30124/g.48576  ORF Transcript_30124/g.48576 Transcript_30124/m.48576 type:complete len:277 (-) Transcript_30124:69-899(-)
MQNQPIASIGFWADCSVPLSAGVDTWKTSAPKQHPVASTVPLLSSLPFDQELEVRDRLASAKEVAGVGDDIRWDLIIEEAAKLRCGLPVGPAAKLPAEKSKGYVVDDDADHRSTSASDSGGEETNALESDTTELEASSQDEAPGLGLDAAMDLLGAKLPPWRRSRTAAAVYDQGQTASNLEAAATQRPWRRSTQKMKPDVCARVYTISTLLRCWVSMQRDVPVICADNQPKPPVTNAPAKTNLPDGIAEEADARTSSPVASNPPWRRRPQLAGLRE